MGHEKPTEEALSTANSEASELKEKGNEAYKNDNLDDALAFYTQGNYWTRTNGNRKVFRCFVTFAFKV